MFYAKGLPGTRADNLQPPSNWRLSNGYGGSYQTEIQSAQTWGYSGEQKTET